MNRNFKKIACFMATALLLTACSQDEMTDGDSLPEGKYPLQIASVSVMGESTAEPWGAKGVQTRVAESTDGSSSTWEWNNTEKIGVRIGGGKPGKYVLASGTVDVVTPCYWASTASGQSVTAWYPAYDEGESGTVNLSDQSQGLAYVLTGSGTGNYNSNVSLSFTHALAKVRVVLNGTDKDKVTGVKIKSYTSCTNTQGTVSTDGASEGWITMKKCTRNGATCWEANVVPDHTITEYQVNDVVSAALEGDGINPLAAKINTIALTVGEAILEPGSDGKFTINAGDDVLIKDYNGTAPIVVNGDATITIDNVQLSPEGTVMTINNRATVTMKVKGKNNSFVSASGSGIALDNNASIHIEGDGASQSTLVVKASETVANDGFNIGIGAKDGNISIDAITIKNISLDVTGGKQHSTHGSGSAAIGLNNLNTGREGGYVQKCTQISIVNSTIKATSDGGACIGIGVIMAGDSGGGDYYGEIGTIQVENSTIQGTSSGNGFGDPGGACVGTGSIVNQYARGKIGRINITNTTFNNGSIGGYTVGCGGVASTGSANSFTMSEGIFVDGQNKGKVGWNP